VHDLSVGADHNRAEPESIEDAPEAFQSRHRGLSSIEMGHAPNRTSPISIAPWEINAAAALFTPIGR
jgi:hypothetical protein